ncbi:hypothetical protein KEJ39_05680 [Candidatus Bathyarchaeota archaeon]|nr:hypothetical protein [Candidatus Bathyarchaeota archaeon]
MSSPPLEYYSRSKGSGLPYGPCDFTEETVEKEVLPGRAGNYAIGYTTPMGGFVVKIIGGSDNDLQEKLLTELDTARKRGYDRFCFKYASSPKERFEHECLNYHSFQRQLDNKEHPQPPSGTELECPDTICARFFQSGRKLS